MDVTDRSLALLALLAARSSWTGAELTDRLEVTAAHPAPRHRPAAGDRLSDRQHHRNGRRLSARGRHPAAAAGLRRRGGGGDRRPAQPGRRQPDRGRRGRGGPGPGQAGAGAAAPAPWPGGRHRRRRADSDADHQGVGDDGRQPLAGADRQRGAGPAGAGLPGRRGDQLRLPGPRRPAIRAPGRAASRGHRLRLVVSDRVRQRPRRLADVPAGPDQQRRRHRADRHTAATAGGRCSGLPVRDPRPRAVPASGHDHHRHDGGGDPFPGGIPAAQPDPASR